MNIPLLSTHHERSMSTPNIKFTDKENPNLNIL